MKKTTSLCPNQKILAVLGGSHMPLIIHTLDSGVWGFNQLQQVTGVNTRTLTKRLQELRDVNLLQSVDCPKDARCRYYQLTKEGVRVHKILQKI